MPAADARSVIRLTIFVPGGRELLWAGVLVPRVLGNACLYLAGEGRGVSRGHAMDGIENIDPSFVQTWRIRP